MEYDINPDDDKIDVIIDTLDLNRLFKSVSDLELNYKKKIYEQIRKHGIDIDTSGNAIIKTTGGNNLANDNAIKTATFDTLIKGVDKIAEDSLSADWVLKDKVFWADRIQKSGEMPNRGAWDYTFDTVTEVYVPNGYHNGSGKLKLDWDSLVSSVKNSDTYTEERTFTAGLIDESYTPTEGKLIRKVTVTPTPSSEKTVTIDKSGSILPETGKLLSKVVVSCNATHESHTENNLTSKTLALGGSETIPANTFNRNDIVISAPTVGGDGVDTSGGYYTIPGKNIPATYYNARKCSTNAWSQTYAKPSNFQFERWTVVICGTGNTNGGSINFTISCDNPQVLTKNGSVTSDLTVISSGVKFSRTWTSSNPGDLSGNYLSHSEWFYAFTTTSSSITLNSNGQPGYNNSRYCLGFIDGAYRNVTGVSGTTSSSLCHASYAPDKPNSVYFICGFMHSSESISLSRETNGVVYYNSNLTSNPFGGELCVDEAFCHFFTLLPGGYVSFNNGTFKTYNYTSAWGIARLDP